MDDDDNTPDPLPEDCTLYQVPQYESGLLIWSDQIADLSRKNQKIIRTSFAVERTEHDFSEMSTLSEEEADRLRESISWSIQEWLENELPQQIEDRIRAVMEEMLCPGYARALEKRLDLELRPRIRKDVESRVIAEFEAAEPAFRQKIIDEERERVRQQLISELTPEVKEALRAEFSRKLGAI